MRFKEGTKHHEQATAECNPHRGPLCQSPGRLHWGQCIILQVPSPGQMAPTIGTPVSPQQPSVPLMRKPLLRQEHAQPPNPRLGGWMGQGWVSG